MKTRAAKFMTLMTIAALSIFSAGNVMAADNNDFYTQPPAGSGWEKADTEGTYASYTNGSDYVNIYKYALDNVKTGIAKCNDTYEACYQTIYSEGNSLYMVVGYAKDAEDIGEVRQIVENISYPGNPSLTTTYGSTVENAFDSQSSGETASSTDVSESNSNGNDSDAGSSSEEGNGDALSITTLTLFDSDGNSVSVDRIIYTNYETKYIDDDGTVYTTDDEVYFTDKNGKTWQALNDDTHYMGAELEQHTLTNADGNSVTVTETTNGDYYFRDADGTGFTDNGDGTWSDENGNSYTE